MMMKDLIRWIILLLQIFPVVLHDASMLTISPRGTQIKTADSGITFTCSIKENVISSRQITRLRWIGPSLRPIEETKGRVYVERYDAEISSTKSSLAGIRLYITKIRDSDSGLYSCEMELSDGKVFAEETRMFIYEDIQFAAHLPNSVQHDIGSSPLIECRATGQPQPEITWRFNGKKITPDNDKYSYEEGKGLRIKKLDLRDSGNYQCRASVESLGSLKVFAVNVDVLYAPVILPVPPSAFVIQDHSFELNCEAHGNPVITYEWFREDKQTASVHVKVKLNAVDGRYVIKRMSAEDEGRYYCRVSNSLGEKEVVVNITMMVPARVTEFAPRSVVLEGQTLDFTCAASIGVPAPNFTWTRGEALIQLDSVRASFELVQPSRSRLILQDVQRTDAGRYGCTATNAAGTDTRYTDVVVEYAPLISVTSLVEQWGWPGQTRSFTCVGTALPPPHISWIRAGRNVSDTAAVKFTITSSSPSSTGVVTSTMQVRLDESRHGAAILSVIYGSYSCIAKNPYGYMAETVYLKEEVTPEEPRNVSVLEEGPTWVTLRAEKPRHNGGERITNWLITFERDTTALGVVSPAIHPGARSEVFQDAENITVVNLLPGTSYIFHLAAGNAVGFGKPVTFRIQTAIPLPPPQITLPTQLQPRGAQNYKEKSNLVQKSWPGTRDGSSDGSMDVIQTAASKPNELHKYDIAVDMNDGVSDSALLNDPAVLLAVVIGVAAVLLTVIIAIVCLAVRKHNTGKTKASSSGSGSYKTKGRLAAGMGGTGLITAASLKARLSDGSMDVLISQQRTLQNSKLCCDSDSSLAKSAPSTRKNSHVLTATSSPSANVRGTLHRVDNCYTKSPTSLHRKPAPTATNSLQRNAWENMLTTSSNRMTDSGIVEYKVGGESGNGCGRDGRPLSISELPPPPAFLLDSHVLSVVSCLAHDIQDGYRSCDSVDDDIDDGDFTIRAPSLVENSE